MAKSINFSIKLNVDGKEQLAKATANVKDLKKAVDQSRTSFQSLSVGFNNIGFAMSNFSSAIGSLSGTMQGLVSAYNASQQSNVQLTTVMKQRMNATDQDIAKVKEVIAAQKELGVVGGVVQIRGAQQIATFLSEKNTLNTLIPAMNNLLAQQKGLNATEEDAYGVANLMGKAMQGQTSALKRVGITFTDAEAQVMKFGTEQQRAAMLAQIITNNVGEMNAALGKTDAGQIKIASNRFASLKVEIGKVVSNYLPAVTMAAQTLTITTSVITLGSAVKRCGVLISSWCVAIANSKVAMLGANAAGAMWNACSIRMAALTNVAKAAFTGATVSATTLKLAIQGLLISTGVGAAIVALTTVVEKFMNTSDNAAVSAEAMANEEANAADTVKDAYEGALKNTYSDLMDKYNRLRAAWSGLRSEHEKTQWISSNKSAFDELKVKINSVADAENIFSKNTNAVVDAFAKRAEAAAYAAKLTALYQKQIALLDKKNKTTEAIADDAKKGGRNAKEGDIVPESWRSERYGKVGNDGQWRFTKVGAERYNGTNTSGNKQVSSIDREISQVDKDIANTKVQMANAAKGSEWITGGASAPTAKTEKPKDPKGTTSTEKEKPLEGSLDWYEQELQRIRKEIQATANEGVAKAKQSEYEQLDKKYQDLKIKIGIDKPEVKEEKSIIEQLQADLQEAQKKFENTSPLDIKAKVEAIAKVGEIQAQIDKATKGEVTIKADVEPSYIEKGSTEDKRQSYSNAQSRASRIQSDFDAGIIDKKEAQRQIDEINDELKQLGLKPIKIDLDVDKESVDAIKSLGNIDLSNMDSVKGSIESIQKITNPTAQGFATAGAACTALGGAMQQLGADSEAAKAGMVMAAVGQIALSFAQALASCKTWVEWLAFGISGTVQMVSLINTISGFATGGIVGGNSTSGDKIPIRVNSGEMILNKAQQARLFALANGSQNIQGISRNVNRQQDIKANPTVMTQISMPEQTQQSVRFKIDGRTLVGVLANETRVSSRSGRRTNIKI